MLLAESKYDHRSVARPAASTSTCGAVTLSRSTAVVKIGVRSAKAPPAGRAAARIVSMTGPMVCQVRIAAPEAVIATSTSFAFSVGVANVCGAPKPLVPAGLMATCVTPPSVQAATALPPAIATRGGVGWSTSVAPSVWAGVNAPPATRSLDFTVPLSTQTARTVPPASTASTGSDASTFVSESTTGAPKLLRGAPTAASTRVLPIEPLSRVTQAATAVPSGRLTIVLD